MDEHHDDDDLSAAQRELLHAIARQGPLGAWALAGVATFIVVAIYVLFYLLAYLPRGTVQ